MDGNAPERAIDHSREAVSGTRHLNAVPEPTAMTAGRMVKLVTELGGSIENDRDLANALHSIVEIAFESIPGADSCGATIAVNDRTFTAVHTDARTLDIDHEQYRDGDGPCLHAARTGEIVSVDTSGGSTRWPEFAAAARREGICSVLSAPLRTAKQTFGSLNLYGESVDAFSKEDIETVSVLTDALARAAGDYERFDAARDATRGLQVALEHRAPIEQAKGILMAINNVGPDEAFAMLTEKSQRANRKLRDIAEEFVRQASEKKS